MVREILTYPEDKNVLTMKSEEVKEINEEIKELIKDMVETLQNTKSGCGISAIQIGVPKKICIIKYNNNYIPMINPHIVRSVGEVVYREGCLSAPSAYKNVNRARKVYCNYLDKDGIERQISQGGLCSIIIQHELDHFDGWCKVFENVEEEK